MSARRYVIVGASAAGMAAAQGIRDIDPEGRITVLSEEPDRPYFRPLIPLLVSKEKTIEAMALPGAGPYRGPDIDIRTHARAVSLDPAANTVSLADGETVSFDRLLIATGSRPNLPLAIGVSGIPGVFVLRTLADARSVAIRADGARQAVVLGGGLAGGKFALALRHRGLDVTLVEKESEILPWLLPADAAQHIRRVLRRAGIGVLAGTELAGIETDTQGVCRVGLSNGRTLPCQLLCIAIGVSPNVEWLSESGVALSRGVVTDRQTASNVVGVYAAGDVAVTVDPVRGTPVVAATWTHAVEMGRCAGRNMAGRPTAYAGAFGIMNATQVVDLPVVAMGIVHSADGDFEVHQHESAAGYRKLVFSRDGHRLLGAVFIGDIERAGLYRALICEGRRMDGLKSAVIDHTLHAGHLLTPNRENSS